MKRCPQCGYSPEIDLTGRERECAMWLLQGLANKEIAKRMNCRERTVKAYIASLLRKYHARNRYQLVALHKNRLSSEPVLQPIEHPIPPPADIQ